MMSKYTCRKCGEIKPLSEFHNDRRAGNGKRTICSDCRNLHRRVIRITKQQRQALLVSQDYSCAICGIKAQEFNKELGVDHNHQTNQIRGLLCTYCNVGLGYFKDDKALLAVAIEYLSKYDGS
jgi:hypothetical protein